MDDLNNGWKSEIKEGILENEKSVDPFSAYMSAKVFPCMPEYEGIYANEMSLGVK